MHAGTYLVAYGKRGTFALVCAANAIGAVGAVRLAAATRTRWVAAGLLPLQAAMVLTVLALNLVGEGLNDALNPRLARRGRA